MLIKAKVVDMALPKTGRIFAVSDIHGAGDLLKRALKRVGFGTADTLFVLGDIVEKRAGGLATLRYIMDLKNRYRVHIICGNCDDLVPGFLDGRDELDREFYDHYFRFFKERSVLVEMGMSLGLTLEDCLDQPRLRSAIAEPFRAEMDFIRSLPTAIRTPEMVFVHGGVPSAQGIEDMEAWCPSIRSKTSIRSSPVRHLADPSLGAAALAVGEKDLLSDMETFGLFFEDLAVRDLRVYAAALGGEVRHYRDNTGLEVDAIIHLKDGRWGAIEIKTGGSENVEKACASLQRLSAKLEAKSDERKASFLMVLTAVGDSYTRADGIHVVPLSALKA